jgi:cell division protein FtsB
MPSSSPKDKRLIQPKKLRLISGTQFVAIVVLTIAIFLIVDFGRRTTAGYYVSQAEQRLVDQIQAELERRQKLMERRDYVASDAYVEEWAREQAHMIRSGDQPFILVTPASPQSRVDLLQSVEPPPSAEPYPNWYCWWLLFFGEQAE